MKFLEKRKRSTVPAPPPPYNVKPYKKEPTILDIFDALAFAWLEERRRQGDIDVPNLSDQEKEEMK